MRDLRRAGWGLLGGLTAGLSLLLAGCGDQLPLSIVVTAPPDNSIIAKNTVDFAGTMYGFSGPVEVHWTNQANQARGGANVDGASMKWQANAVNLKEGSNTVVFTLLTSERGTATATNTVVYEKPPTVRLTAPANGQRVVTSADTFTASGQLDNAGGAAEVAWENSQGGHNSARVGAKGSWTTAPIRLYPGDNELTFAATNDHKNSGVAKLTVTYNPPSEPPVLTILSPRGDGAIYETDHGSLTIAGVALDALGIDKVEYAVNGGAFRPASLGGGAAGHWPWTIALASLPPGTSRVGVRAINTKHVSSGETDVLIHYERPAKVPPKIAITSPGQRVVYYAGPVIDLDGTAEFGPGAQISIQCLASDERGNITLIPQVAPVAAGPILAIPAGPSSPWHARVRLVGPLNRIVVTITDANGTGQASLDLWRTQRPAIAAYPPTSEYLGPKDRTSALEQARAVVDEYGTISITAPVLTYARSNEFLFNLTNGAAYYFNDAKTNTQGQAASFTQSARSTALALQAQADPTQTAAYMSAARNFMQQQSAYQLQQESQRQAANAQLQALLQQAATNTTVGASNLAAASALQSYSQQVYGTNGPPVFPVASSFNTNLPGIPTNLLPASATNTPQLRAMTDFLGLLPSIPSGLALEDRTAIITAAGDNAIEAFFRALGNSQLFGNFLYSEVYFGLTTVSVNPGWRTKTDWAAEVTVAAELDFHHARRETIQRVLDDPLWPANVRARVAADYGYPYNDAVRLKTMGIKRAQEIAAAFPATDPAEALAVQLSGTTRQVLHVMVISPLVEAQTLNLADSQRAQSQMALYLAAALQYAGASGAGQAFAQFAKSRQQDAATRTPLSMVNAFAGQDGSYGFQVGPRFQALNPGKGLGRPSSVLERQSFPALILISACKGDVEPRVKFETGRFMVMEPYITLRQTPRWVSLKHFRFSHGDWYKPYNWFTPALCEQQRDDIASKLGAVIQARDDGSFREESSFRRAKTYFHQLLGSQEELKLPYDRMVPEVAAQDPSVTNIVPHTVALRFRPTGQLDEAPVTFVLQGQNLDAVGAPISTLYPNAANLSVLAQSASALSVQAAILNSDYPLVFQLPSKVDNSARSVLAPPVIVRNPRIVPCVMDTQPSLVTLHRSTNNDPMTTNFTIVMVGSGLRRVDAAGATLASGFATLAAPVQAIGDGLRATVTVTNAGQAISFRLPVPPLGESGATNFVLSLAVQVDLDPTNAPAAKPAAPPTLEVDKYRVLPVSTTTVMVATNATPEAVSAAALVAAAAQGATNRVVPASTAAATNSAGK